MASLLPCTSCPAPLDPRHHPDGTPALVLIDPCLDLGAHARPSSDTTDVVITSLRQHDLLITRQWTGAGSQDQRDTTRLPPGGSETVAVAGWLGRDCDFITVSTVEVSALAADGGGTEVWNVDEAQQFTLVSCTAPAAPQMSGTGAAATATDAQALVPSPESARGCHKDAHLFF